VIMALRVIVLVVVFVRDLDEMVRAGSGVDGP